VHENAIKNLEEEDKDITEKKRVINEQLELVEKKMDHIKDNAKAVTEEI
jgi:prefoldin subunit 5